MWHVRWKKLEFFFQPQCSFTTSPISHIQTSRYVLAPDLYPQISDMHWKLQLGTQELEEPLGKRAGRTLKLVLPAPRLGQSHGHRPSGPTLRPGEVPPRAGEPRVGNIPPQEWEHANGGGKLGQRIFFSSVFREPPTPRSALTSVCHPRVAENADSTQKKTSSKVPDRC